MHFNYIVFKVHTRIYMYILKERERGRERLCYWRRNNCVKGGRGLRIEIIFHLGLSKLLVFTSKPNGSVNSLFLSLVRSFMMRYSPLIPPPRVVTLYVNKTSHLRTLTLVYTLSFRLCMYTCPPERILFSLTCLNYLNLFNLSLYKEKENIIVFGRSNIRF